MKERITAILSELTCCENISPDSLLREDLMLDSFSMVSLLIELENEFDVFFDESDLDFSELTTVRDVFSLVERYEDEK